MNGRPSEPTHTSYGSRMKSTKMMTRALSMTDSMRPTRAPSTV